MQRFLWLLSLCLLVTMMQSNQLPADEGLWLFNNPPKEHLKKKYNFDAPQSWYDHLQKSAVRFPSGSGSFVSADGLLMTNHHVAVSALKRLTGLANEKIKVEKDRKDYVRDGFHAKSLEEEFKVAGL